MLTKGKQLQLKSISQYIFEWKSLRTIERNLQKSINQRFKTKIHFISSQTAKSTHDLGYLPLPCVLQEEISETYEKFTPSKSTNKQMRMHSTASKISSQHMQSPQSTCKKSKQISKERKASFFRKSHERTFDYYATGQRLRV